MELDLPVSDATQTCQQIVPNYLLSLLFPWLRVPGLFSVALEFGSVSLLGVFGEYSVLKIIIIFFCSMWARMSWIAHSVCNFYVIEIALRQKVPGMIFLTKYSVLLGAMNVMTDVISFFALASRKLRGKCGLIPS